MFTGLIERTGTMLSASAGTDRVWTLVIDPGPDYAREHGASIAVNGTCLTEVGTGGEGLLTFHVSQETLDRTSLGSIKVNDPVNLERAMRPTDRLGGHIVLGHVDGTGTVMNITKQEGFVILTIQIPRDLARYVVIKGSLCVDGTSLTVNHITDHPEHSEVSFTLIPVTWTTTRFSRLKIGERVNIEVDMIAKHLERLALPWKLGTKNQ
jgi:riboflavin synthase